MELIIYDTGRSSAADNMKVDRELLAALPSTPYALLHLYGWQCSSATFGHFSQPEKLLNPEALSKYQLELAKRPTGGGIIFHDFDFTFSVLLSAAHPYFSLNTLENYQLINNIIIDSIRQFTNHINHQPPTLLKTECKSSEPNACHFCMAKPTIYDVVFEGRKIAGGAQRQTKQGFLHQGSIALTLPSDIFLNEILNCKKGVIDAIKNFSFPLLPSPTSSSAIESARKDLKRCLIDQFSAKLSEMAKTL